MIEEEVVIDQQEALEIETEEAVKVQVATEGTSQDSVVRMIEEEATTDQQEILEIEII